MSSSSSSETSPSPSGDDFYEISAVARITGLSTHNLRVWERRHKVVEPVRTETKRRLYSRDDVRKLGLLKALVDSGDSISQLAGLDASQLEKRLTETGQAGPTNSSGNSAEKLSRRCRLALAGHFVRGLFNDEGALWDQFRVVSEYDTIDDLKSAVRPMSVDVAILEEATLFDERVEAIQQMLSKIKTQRAIVIYQFAPRAVIARIETEFPQITTLRAPVNATEVRLACLAGMPLLEKNTGKRRKGSGRDLGEGTEETIDDRIVPETEIPERHFSDSELAAISRLAGTIKCECPQHLASLLSGLLAFETYSSQCENRNADDAKLHAYLHRSTANARAAMEKALVAVLESEDIDIGS